MLEIFNKYNKMIITSNRDRLMIKDTESLDDRVRKFNEKKKRREEDHINTIKQLRQIDHINLNMKIPKKIK